MAAEFLTPKEIPKRLADFKDRWYDVVARCEGIKDFKSGREQGLPEALDEAARGISELKDTLETINLSIKREFPELREDSEAVTERLLDALDSLGGQVGRELEAATEFQRLVKALEDATAMLDEAERRYREVEAETAKICGKYFERKSEYTQQADMIKRAFEEKVAKIKDKYLARLNDLCEGYQVFVAGREVTVDELFMGLVREPSTADAVSLVKKEEKRGLFDFKRKDEEMDKTAKYEVLKYTTGEIAAEVAPMKKEETQALVRLDSRFGDLRKLEMECRDAEAKREELQRPRDELKEEMRKYRNSELLALEKYDYILSVHDRFLKAVGEIKPVFKEFMEFVEGAVEGYEVPEKDVEKRELKEEIKRLKGAKKALEDEVIELEKKLQKQEEEASMLKAEAGKLREELEEAVARQEEIEKRVSEMEGLLERVEKGVGEVWELFSKKRGGG
ncbi:MAG: hypothetical protein GXO65_03210 [Euryarchaeota archaeon]|nr:hypothetical protein [Euryarchaeota archaeon]